MERLPQIVYVEDAVTGEDVYVSPQIEAVYGYTPEEWLETPNLFWRVLHPDDVERVRAVRDILGEDGPAADYRAVSRVTFTDPEVGSVGMTERQAREAGLQVRTGHADIPESSRGWIHQAGNEGIVKLVADADAGVLVGATAVAPAGGEVLGLLAAAVHARIPLETLRSMHFAYPTFHRAIEAALADLGS